MEYNNIEFKNYERELKYLLTGNVKLSIKKILEFLDRYGYKILETFQKEKHESYYDDSIFTIINRGDVMRGSDMVTEKFFGFMYKKNMSNPSKPYVSKLELGSVKYKTVEEFTAEVGLDVNVLPVPVLYANMRRDVAVVERNGDHIYITFDIVEYYRNFDTEHHYEEMLEIEDWKTPNSTDGNYNYDAHLCEINEIVLDGELPIKLTKDTKPYRGYKILKDMNLL